MVADVSRAPCHILVVLNQLQHRCENLNSSALFLIRCVNISFQEQFYALEIINGKYSESNVILMQCMVDAVRCQRYRSVLVSHDVLAGVAEVLQSDRVVLGWNGLNAR